MLYNKGKPMMSDTDFDALKVRLKDQNSEIAMKVRGSARPVRAAGPCTATRVLCCPPTAASSLPRVRAAAW